ncbi:MAG TPA: hypothetical protein DCR35_14965 [Runella sp.]|nr:hypothetical protein [Runella sp.]HAO50482.1 hypothetical protein [Runella sp.]
MAANAQTIFQAQEVNKAATPQGAITSRNGKPVRQAFNYEVLKGIGSGCDEDALRVVKEMNG